MKIPGMERRTFQLGVIYSLWALMGAAVSIPAAIYLLFPPRARRRAKWIEIADVSRMKINAPEQVSFRRVRADGWKVTAEKTIAWVVRQSERDVVAFTSQCTHLGCAYHWNQSKNEFLCPCHTSTFDLNGKVLTGPAPRPLDRYQVKLEGTKLLIGDPEKSQNA